MDQLPKHESTLSLSGTRIFRGRRPQTMSPDAVRPPRRGSPALSSNASSADPNERQFAPGRSAATVPSTPQALENTWRASRQFETLEIDRKSYEKLMETEKHDQEAFRAAVLEDKKKGVSEKSPYTLGLFAQVKALTIRQFQLRLQDSFQLYTSFSMSIVSCFRHCPPSVCSCSYRVLRPSSVPRFITFRRHQTALSREAALSLSVCEFTFHSFTPADHSRSSTSLAMLFSCLEAFGEVRA